jgi:hypothetical protein
MLSPQLQRNHQEAAFDRVQIAADAANRIEGAFLVGGELILGGATRSSLLAIWETSLSMLCSAAGAGHSTTGARFGAWASAVKPRVKALPHRPAAASFSPFIVRPLRVKLGCRNSNLALRWAGTIRAASP